MNFNSSYEEEFETMMLFLKSKYGKEIFDLDGIGRQTDLNQFSRDFFSNKTTTADISSDANSNVDSNDVVSYIHELPKPFMRMNSYYILWKKLKSLYGVQEANRIIEAQVTGDIYINDFSDIARPYSYHPDTTIVVRDERGHIYSYTLIALFNKHKDHVKHFDDYDEIDLTEFNLATWERNYWVGLERVVRHKSHTNLRQIKTYGEKLLVVTTDHPVILEDESERKAETINVKDKLLETRYFGHEGYSYDVDTDTNIWYRFGCVIGDDNMLNSIDTSIFKKYDYNFIDYLNNLRELGAEHKYLPHEMFELSRINVRAMLAGIIDTGGNIDATSGEVTITHKSLAFIQQLTEFMIMLNYTSFKIMIKDNKYTLHFYINHEDMEISFISTKVKENFNIIYTVNSSFINNFADNEIQLINEIPFIDEYVYDITTESGRFYTDGLVQHNCFNYSTYDIATSGLPMIKKINSIAPKYLNSFKSQIEQFVVIASNSTLGATGLADILIVMSYYVDKILRNNNTDAHVRYFSEEDVWMSVREELVSLIYTLNQPMRGAQSPFTNISVYDEYFLDTLIPNYPFYEGDEVIYPKKEIIKRIQEIYLDVMNKEMSRTPVTFPVTTACFSLDDERNIQDENFLKMCCKYDKDYAFINFYSGKSSILSSCCRSTLV